MLKKLFNKKYLFDYLAIFAVFLFSLAGSLVSVNRFWQYEVFYYDFGIFDQALWNASRFHAPIIEHLVVGGKWIFADHFNPSLFLLTPLYWLTDRSEIMLIAQAVIVGLSGLFLYLIGRELLKNKFWAFSILIVYFLFIGIQNAVITDFHEITIAVLPFIAAYYFLLKKKYIIFFILFVIVLGFKESNFALGIGMAISVLLIDRKLWKLAAICGVFSLVWGQISINYIIPHFSNGIYQYKFEIDHNPIKVASLYIDDAIKRRTIFYNFWSFGFLPIFSYQFWAIILEEYLGRFYSPMWFTRWGLGFHYNAIIGATFGMGTIFVFKMFNTRFKKKKMVLNILAVMLMLNAFYLYRFELHGPFGLAYNKDFYRHSNEFSFLNNMIEKIPPTASVLTLNNLAAHFTHQNVYLVRGVKKGSEFQYYQLMKPQPDYIVLDTRAGQNPNNFFVMTNEEMEDFLKVLNSDKNYKVIYKVGDQSIYKKN